MFGKSAALPEWEAVLSAAAHLQQILPGAVLVERASAEEAGGSARRMVRSKVFGHVAMAVWLGCAAQLALAGSGRLLDLLAGEYNNNEQVWQQGLDGVPATRRHWRFERMDEGRIGLAVAEGQSAPAIGWTLAFAEGDAGVRAAVSQADGADLGCRYLWEPREDGFAAAAEDAAACPDPLPALWRISPTHLIAAYDAHGKEGGERAHRARRALPYAGWVSLQRQRIDPQAAADEQIFLKDLRLHDEGFVLSIKDGERPTGYAVELARLTYQRTRVAVLKLGVIDEATGKTLSYSWAEPRAKRIGINLRWIQAGFTRTDD